MDVLVTGGHGALGRFVVEELAARGHDTTVLDLEDDEARRSAGGYAFVQADITDADAVASAVADHDAVIHLAALKRPACEADPQLATEVNVGGTVAVFEAAVAADARVVQISSKSVFGHVAGAHAYPSYEPLDEGAPKHVTGDIYGLTKAATEAYRASYVEKHGLEAASFRFASTYGPGKVAVPGKGMLIPGMIEGAARGETISVEGADELNDWIYFGDVANGLVDAVEADEFSYPVYHIGTGRLRSVADFATILKERFPEASIEVSGGRNPQGQEHPMYARLDISRAISDLGYEPRYDLQAGIDDYLERLDDRSDG